MADQKPNPGSDAAQEQGCQCATLDNHRGRGYRGQPGIFVVTLTCPLHGLDDEGKPR